MVFQLNNILSELMEQVAKNIPGGMWITLHKCKCKIDRLNKKLMENAMLAEGPDVDKFMTDINNLMILASDAVALYPSLD